MTFADRYEQSVQAGIAPVPTERHKPHRMDVREIIRKAGKARNGFVFRALWAGDTSNYKSQSEADQALQNLLAFWCRKDAQLMDEMFRLSGLYRPKWDEKHGAKTYGEMTIEKAIADCTNVYDPEHRRQKVQDDFADCRYGVNDLPSYKPDDMTDTGNSRVFAKSVADRLIWLDSDGFRRWNGMYWELSPNAGLGMGKAHTDRMLEEAGSILADVRQRKAELEEKKAALGAQEITGVDESPELLDLKTELDEVEREEKRAGAYYGFTLNSRSRVRINAFVELAKPDILVDSDQLNVDPFALNTPGGIVDVRTGIVRPHDPMEYCTSITAVSPSYEGMELWQDHLRLVTCDSPDLMRFHQEVAGMSIIGRVFMENLLIALGDGANGKSTLYNVQLLVLGGGYAGSINPEVLTTDKRNAGADFATLKGKRLIIAAELEEGKRLSTSILKRLTSTDPIQAERKYFDPESFTPTHSTILYTNHVPRLGSMDNGTKRRIKLVPFPARIPTDGEKKNYTQELFEKAGGAVLQWMIEGAQMFVQNGYTLSPCSEVSEATQKYFEDNDWITPFLEECCIVEPGRKCAGGALYQAYSTRAEREGEYARRNADFARELERLGFWKERTKLGAEWHGLAIRANVQPGYGFSAYP